MRLQIRARGKLEEMAKRYACQISGIASAETSALRASRDMPPHRISVCGSFDYRCHIHSFGFRLVGKKLLARSIVRLCLRWSHVFSFSEISGIGNSRIDNAHAI